MTDLQAGWEADLYTIRREAGRIVQAADDPNIEVPTCPGWTLIDLLWHVVQVEQFWHQIVSRRLTDPDRVAFPERRSDYALLHWTMIGARDLVDLLTERGPAVDHWTWIGPAPDGWVARRVANELTVHRADAQFASGRAVAIETTRAIDIVDEYLGWMLAQVGGPKDGGQATEDDLVVEITNGPHGPALWERRLSGLRSPTRLVGEAAAVVGRLWGRPITGMVDVQGDEEGLHDAVDRGVDR
ncbi:MAG: maleylpyruvate isomerase family mycothiol-dependent enzyme [Actinomycetia bacterium]|nr:maleylpyruvate isomerase family mycothiol-dependent enzyme [Actinomycetes bacterium]